MNIRPISERDHAPIIAVVDQWWGGRQMAGLLPRLFFAHFQDTSFVIEEDDQIIAFLDRLCVAEQPAPGLYSLRRHSPRSAQAWPGQAAVRAVFRNRARARLRQCALHHRADQQRLDRLPSPHGLPDRKKRPASATACPSPPTTMALARIACCSSKRFPKVFVYKRLIDRHRGSRAISSRKDDLLILACDVAGGIDTYYTRLALIVDNNDTAFTNLAAELLAPTDFAVPGRYE